MGKRGQGEDSVYFDHRRGAWVADPDDDLHKPCRGRWAAAVSLGFGPDGKRIRRKVTGKTKTAVKDQLRTLRREIEAPKYRTWPAGGDRLCCYARSAGRV